MSTIRPQAAGSAFARTPFAGTIRSLSAFLLAAWSVSVVADASCSTFSFHLRAEPSFHANSTIVIEGNPGSASVSIEIDSNRSGQNTERLALAPGVAREFCLNMRRIAKMEQPPVERRLLDGCPVQGRFLARGAGEFTFSSNSPDPMSLPRDFAAVDTVFATLEKTDPSCKMVNYLELLSMYFHYGLKARITSQNPVTLRFHGGLATGFETELDRLLGSLPTDRPVLMDMTNLDGMTPQIFPRFRGLLNQGERVTWLASTPDVVKELQQMGVDRGRIEVVKWPYCSEERPRFVRGGKPDRK
jgi:hypothetical protein